MVKYYKYFLFEMNIECFFSCIGVFEEVWYVGIWFGESWFSSFSCVIFVILDLVDGIYIFVGF